MNAYSDPVELIGHSIRSLHPYGFRSGQWAEIKDVVVSLSRHRMGYLVQFPDGIIDLWVMNDAAAQYEFKFEKEQHV